jgi:hypothetical protein
MCIGGGGAVGPQKYSGGNAASSGDNDNDNDDSDGNAFGSIEYHKKIRDDADKRRTTGSREAAEGRKGQKSLLGSIKSIF